MINVFVNFDKLDLQGRPVAEGALTDDHGQASQNPGTSASSTAYPEELKNEDSFLSSDATDTDSDEETKLGAEESKRDVTGGQSQSGPEETVEGVKTRAPKEEDDDTTEVQR